MKLEQKVVSLELAKQLKEAGYKQEGSFYWADTVDGIKLVYSTGIKGIYGIYGEIGLEVSERSIICLTPTVAELGERLPTGFRSGRMENNLFKGYNKKVEFELPEYSMRDLTEANLRAKILIWLLKNTKIHKPI